MDVNPKRIFLLACVIGLMACDTDPRVVFVPITEPQVELYVRASSVEVSVDEPVVLYAERWNRGEWKLVERKKLTHEQCWLRRPPPIQEKEVADNLRWEAFPSKGARFNTTFRADHTREVVFREPGTYILESSSQIWCVPDLVVKGKPIETVVHNDVVGEKTSF